MDELGSESAPNFSQSDIKSRVSDTILEKMEAILIQKPNPGRLYARPFHSTAPWTLATSASSFSNLPGRKYSTRSVATL